MERSGGGDLANGATQDFGVWVLGKQGTTFTLRNRGSADLVLSGTPRVVVSGPDTADFQVTVQPESPVPEAQTAIGLANGSFGAGAWSGRMGLPPSGSGWVLEQAGIGRQMARHGL